MSQLLELEPVHVKKSPRTQAPAGPAPVTGAREQHADPLQLDPVLVTPLRRPERRKSRKATPLYARPAMIRIALGIVVAAVVFSFAGRIAAFAMEPVYATWSVGNEIKKLEAGLAKQKAVNARLQGDIRYLDTRAGVEQQARRLGYVKPNEIALTIVLPDPPAMKPADKRLEPVRTAVNMPIADRIRSAVDTCLSVF
jgi:cell division protein FtsB